MYPISPPEPYLFKGKSATLTEHLGYRASDKLVVINADDFGLTSGVNSTILELFSQRRISSTTIMVTAGEYREAVNLILNNSFINCGIHLTMTSSLPESPARPILSKDKIPSLVDEAGEFHFDREIYFSKAIPAEAQAEAEAQIDRALADRIDVTHLDSHEGTLQLRPEFAEVYLNLAAKYRLPIRMGSRLLLSQIGFSQGWIERARRLQLHFPDNFIYLPLMGFSGLAEKMRYMHGLLDSISEGVTELYFHPASPQLEQRLSLSGGGEPNAWHVRQWDYQILTSSEFWEHVDQLGIQLISFKQIRNLMRS